jgi:hypothetical protein
VDYIFKTTVSLDERIATLAARAKEAREEADEAHRNPGLDGPAQAAEGDARELEAELADLRQVQKRIERVTRTGIASGSRPRLTLAAMRGTAMSCQRPLLPSTSSATAASTFASHSTHRRHIATPSIPDSSRASRSMRHLRLRGMPY